MLRFVSTVGLVASLGGCALDPYHLSDAEDIPLVRRPDFVVDFTKSLKCEVTTFIVENRLRSAIVSKAKENIEHEFLYDTNTYEQHLQIIRSNPYIDVDSGQFAYMSLDFKKVGSLALSAPVDWKKTLTSHSTDWHVGPTYNDNTTNETTQPIGLPQYNDLGPKRSFSPHNEVPKAATYSTIYYKQADDDADFYCYHSLFPKKSSVTLEDAASDIQYLLSDNPDWVAYRNFNRIYVSGIPLAQWLQGKAALIDKADHHVFGTTLSLFSGQYIYQFSLEFKPGIDVRDTYAATFINPLVPELAASLDHTSSFAIYLNQEYAAQVLAAKSGDTKLGSLHPQ
jgi:hypothetical protein